MTRVRVARTRGLAGGGGGGKFTTGSGILGASGSLPGTVAPSGGAISGGDGEATGVGGSVKAGGEATGFPFDLAEKQELTGTHANTTQAMFSSVMRYECAK